MSSGGQPRQTTFFFDACISPRIVEVLNLVQTEDSLVHMFSVDGFGRDDADVVWIPKVAALGHVLVTCDNAQRRNEVERVLRQEVKIRTVFLPSGYAQLDRWGQVRFAVNYWQNIAKDTRRAKDGDTFLVSMNGKTARHVPKK